jgi:hypothetical protein
MYYILHHKIYFLFFAFIFTFISTWFSFFMHLYAMERLTLKHSDDIRAQILSYLATDDPEIQYLLRLNALLLLTMKDGPSAAQSGYRQRPMVRGSALRISKTKAWNRAESEDVPALDTAPGRCPSEDAAQVECS